MKFNSTFSLIAAFVLMMLGSGAASAWYSLKMGHEALQGINQPDVNPTKQLTEKQHNSTQPKKFVAVNEKDILAKVNTYIQRKGNPLPESGQNKGAKTEELPKKVDNSPEKPASAIPKSPESNLPLKAEAQGVTLEVTKVNQQGGSVVLEVNLKNDGTKAVEFLYSFLEVKDNQGRSLSAMTDGLPQEIPAKSETFSGTVKIPASLLDSTEQISLHLTDYPEQELQLDIPKIPVK